MENFVDFKDRINSFIWKRMPINTHFIANPHVSAKIEDDGRMKPFYGNTVVFGLPEYIQGFVRSVQNALYDQSGHIFAEPLKSDTFHLTLHDLLNGNKSENLIYEVEQMYEKVKEIFEWIAEQPRVMRFKTTALYVMVNTSVVLGVEPFDEESYQTLMELYEKFQKLVPLNYPLTPHITIAYFKPGQYEADELHAFRDLIDQVNKIENLFTLDAYTLMYQIFEDMNHYDTILKLE